ncbi:lipopolysaccharide biosynthesis protein [Xylanibacillus composti]|uniref:Lipopolysaccharide biosynthesis protein n=1 Tax=Xylanibacillus composti TaxID=1572762 RepID=A0A8J4H2H9_9BACL|nr:lipopolysaccharide biosynthesis protein [Xylanibacillus composti]MDT9724504.1 lipopolysaccharide biosynthesis protein [Xylanibacillus composti]GIQ69767.1 lipopolysaccharide biosynthesis protein [Xylanibacillus composti]
MRTKSNFDTGFSGVFWMGMMTILNYCAQLVITYFLARLLSPADYGEVVALTILIGLAELFWMFGVGPAIVQKADISKDDIITGNTLNILFGIFVFIVINILAIPLVKLFSISDIVMLRVFSFVFILNSLASLSQALSQKKCRFKRISVVRSISIIFYGGAAISLAFMQFGPWALVYANLLQALLVSVLFLILEPVPVKFKIHKESAGKLLHFGGGFTLARFFNYLATRGDSFVINKLMGKSELGLYTRAQQLLMYPVNLVGETLDQVLFPLLSQNNGDKKKLKQVFLNGTGTIAFITAPIAIAAFIRAEEMIVFFLGENWLDAVLPFRMLIIGLFFRTGYKLSESLVRAMGKVYQGALIQVIYALFVVAGAYLGHFYGLAGVASGVTVAFTVNYILLTGLCMYLVRISMADLLRTIVPSLIYSTIAIAAVMQADPLFITLNNPLLICVVTAVFVFLVYLLCFVMLKKWTMSAELRAFILALAQRFSLRRRKLKRVQEANA